MNTGSWAQMLSLGPPTVGKSLGLLSLHRDWQQPLGLTGRGTPIPGPSLFFSSSAVTRVEGNVPFFSFDFFPALSHAKV